MMAIVALDVSYILIGLVIGVILADILEDRGRKAIEETGIAEDVFTIWEKARDKKAVEEMFEVLCDCSFQEYFGKCIQQITRSNCSCWGRIGGAYHES